MTKRPTDENNLQLNEFNNNLVSKIVAFLQGNNQNSFLQKELDSGTFIHCLILALIKLEYIKSSQHVELEHKIEESRANLREHVDLARKIHHHHVVEEWDAEDLIALQESMQKVIDKLPKENEDYSKLDPKELLDLRQKFRAILERLDLVTTAEDHRDRPAKKKM